MATNPTEQPSCECDDTPPAIAGTTAPIRVLLIDDDSDDYELTKDIVEGIPGGGFVLDWTADNARGLDAICDKNHDAFLLDFRLGAQTGLALLAEAQARGCSGPVIILTGQGESNIGHQAVAAGAHDFLEKSELTPKLLERSIRFSIAQYRAATELEHRVQRRTEQLQQANSALEDNDRRKDLFLSMLAHELRNPLAPIQTSLEIMRLSGDTGPGIPRQRERIERQVNQLVRLVDDLLDVARISNDKLRLVIEQFPLQDLLEVAVDACRGTVARAGLVLTTDWPNDPVMISGDRVRLMQVFGNLLNNASKFTPTGGIVSVRVAVQTAFVVVEVSDTGEGIPPESIAKLFGMFVQLETTQHRKSSGLGIGLALAHRLVGMHGGTISAHSDGPGTGATFTVSLPLLSADG